MKKIIATISFSLLFLTSSFGEQNYYFDHYTTSDGLLSNTIYCTIQDSRGFIWIGTRDGISIFDGKEFYNFGDITNSKMGARTGAMCLDNDGCIWFTTTEGCFCFNPASCEIKRYNIHFSIFETIICDRDNTIWVISGDIVRIKKKSDEITIFKKEEYIDGSMAAVDSYGKLWVTDCNGDLYMHNANGDKFTLELEGYNFHRILAIEDYGLLLSDKEGRVYCYDLNPGIVRMIIDNGKEGNNSNVIALLERVSGEYWIGTENGILVYSKEEGRIVSKIENNASDPNTISASYIQCLGKDWEGNVWAGTFYKGLNLWKNKKKAYDLHYNNYSGKSINGDIVRSIVSTNNGKIWIATEDGCLDELDILTNDIVHHNINGEKHNYQFILPIDGNLWIASFDSGIYVYDSHNRTLKAHYSLSSDRIICLLQTSENKILAGTSKGLYIYNPDSDIFSLIESTAGKFIHTLLQDSAGNIWTGTYESGIFLFDNNVNLTAHIINETDGNSISSNIITSFFEDSKERMWVTTEGGGLNMIPLSTLPNHKFKKYTKQDGLPSNIICAVAEDKSGNLWISTSKGLIEMYPETETFGETYYIGPQVTGNQYSYGAKYSSPNGTLYFGAINGIVSLNPTALTAANHCKEIYISHIAAYSNDKTTQLLACGITPMNTSAVKVKYKDVSTLTIHFSTPYYSNITNPQYEYTLRKGHNENSSRTRENNVSFSNLSPGKYIFDVWPANETSETAHKSIKLTIVPPFYRSLPAWLIYILTIIFLSSALISYIWKSKKERNSRRMNDIMEQQIKDIYNSKINFFTNLTHEIRTPLTLIKMPVDKMIEQRMYTTDSEKDMMTIQANVDKLLTLTNELLDIKKLENNDQRLSFTRQDIIKTIENTISRYSSIIADRNIKIIQDIPSGAIIMMYAEESVSKIISNLISNAIKYGKDIIRISLIRDDEKVKICVDSNGEKLSHAESNHIFEKFYTGGKGTGLGLPLSKALAELHGGKLYVDCNIAEFNRFVLELPMVHPEEVEIRESGLTESQANNEEYDSSRHTLLVVEDDIDLRAYLSSELSELYNTVTAGNGKEALEILETQKIDLVISDIMMPVMDGCDLCDNIKTNIEYSHVPVILLTAAVGMETRMETLEVGADGYLEKPFSIDLLKATIKNLFKNKEIAYHQFANSPLTHYRSVAANTVDDEFMNRIHTVIMDNMSDQDLNINTLTTMLNTSKSSLYRKIKSNTGLNINEYIRLCRLKKAAEMLSSQKYRVNEVGYLVGFSSPSYFATCFQKQFNISPSAFVKKLKE